MRRGPKVHMGRRYEVLAWVPSKALVDAAMERTEGLVGYFLQNASTESHREWINDLETLARSCYLQGANDTAKVAAALLDEQGRSTSVHSPGGAENIGQYQESQTQPAEMRPGGRLGLPDSGHDEARKRQT